MEERHFMNDSKIRANIYDQLGFDQLRVANEKREVEWTVNCTETPGVAFAAMELAGEVGELCNELKKVERKRLGLVGGKEIDYDAIADELGDVVVCVDLLAHTLGVDLGAAVRRKFNKTSTKHNFETKI